jgi:hypothetical protein
MKRNWWIAHALIAGSYAVTALASFLALRMFTRGFAVVWVEGGGIGAVSYGIWQATRLPFVASWIAVIATLLAGIFLFVPIAGRDVDRERLGRPATFAAVTALALAAGAAPILLFRRAIDFVLAAILPATAPQVNAAARYQLIMDHLLTAAVVSAGCFVVLTALVITIVRSRHALASRRLAVVTVLALVLSLTIATTFVTTLHSSSTHYRDVALHGRAAP